MFIAELVSSPVTAGFGLAAVVACWVFFFFRGKTRGLTTSVLVFLAGSAVPVGLALTLVPFVPDPPSIELFEGYLPIVGLALIGFAVATIRRAIVDPDPDASA